MFPPFCFSVNRAQAGWVGNMPCPQTPIASLPPASPSPDLTPRPLLMAFSSISQVSAASLKLVQMSLALLSH